MISLGTIFVFIVFIYCFQISIGITIFSLLSKIIDKEKYKNSSMIYIDYTISLFSFCISTLICILCIYLSGHLYIADQLSFGLIPIFGIIIFIDLLVTILICDEY